MNKKNHMSERRMNEISIQGPHKGGTIFLNPERIKGKEPWEDEFGKCSKARPWLFFDSSLVDLAIFLYSDRLSSMAWKRK